MGDKWLPGVTIASWKHGIWTLGASSVSKNFSLLGELNHVRVFT